MPLEGSFADFVRRIRAGDGEAAVALVRQYEPAIRLEVRLRLSDPSLRRVFDSMDALRAGAVDGFLEAGPVGVVGQKREKGDADCARESLGEEDAMF